MQNGGGTQRNEHARQYLRSTRFRVLSWLSAALVAASFLVPNHRVWGLYAAVAVSFAAMLPILRVVQYKHRVDIYSRSDRRFLLLVALYVGIIVIGAFVVAYFGSR